MKFLFSVPHLIFVEVFSCNLPSVFEQWTLIFCLRIPFPLLRVLHLFLSSSIWQIVKKLLTFNLLNYSSFRWFYVSTGQTVIDDVQMQTKFIRDNMRLYELYSAGQIHEQSNTYKNNIFIAYFGRHRLYLSMLNLGWCFLCGH